MSSLSSVWRRVLCQMGQFKNGNRRLSRLQGGTAMLEDRDYSSGTVRKDSSKTTIDKILTVNSKKEGGMNETPATNTERAGRRSDPETSWRRSGITRSLTQQVT
ncbi:hypothetical protein TNCV_4647981 [Trichonephila clavipes]|uniref:Uncharacterized protein n=1 Tax=Trichonephila clavipes TaxID=2585209 RepID=A0A8X6T3Y5_TRICX|nr:hypothetical protein TNCV_4647981 [Trichonephila clavipes]